MNRLQTLRQKAQGSSWRDRIRALILVYLAGVVVLGAAAFVNDFHAVKHVGGTVSYTWSGWTPPIWQLCAVAALAEGLLALFVPTGHAFFERLTSFVLISLGFMYLFPTNLFQASIQLPLLAAFVFSASLADRAGWRAKLAYPVARIAHRAE